MCGLLALAATPSPPSYRGKTVAEHHGGCMG
jgi:hypothetical protein